MTTAVTTGTNTSGLFGASSTSKSTSQTDASASQDRFLKLLVAQLNNQDPMNPMDNAQMTSQMAQINTVSGIAQLNETMKSMATQFNAMQVLQGASMIGHSVLTEGNKLPIYEGKAGGAVDVAGAADKVTVQVFSPGGQLVDTIELGSKTAGRHSFEWDASKYTGGGTPTFKVSATQGTKAVATTGLSRDTVVSIGNDGTSMNFQLKSGAVVAYSAIKAVL
jgi:flagellar basal-body rod modification protein FlgD